MKIKTPQLRKDAQIPCPHLVEKGCGIYESRPPVCRSFLCGWRLTPELDASWRPDRSGVMLLPLAQAQTPKAYSAAGNGWVFVISGGDKAITPRLARFIAVLVERRVAVFLSAMTPRIQLNEQLEAAGDLDGVLRILRQTHARLLPASTGTGVGRIWALYRAQVDRMRAIMEQRRP
ncbi:MAG: hypothetical protein ABI450_05845 [Rhizomicrobium sp.]